MPTGQSDGEDLMEFHFPQVCLGLYQVDKNLTSTMASLFCFYLLVCLVFGALLFTLPIPFGNLVSSEDLTS